MEKKEINKRDDSFWAFFDNRNDYRSFFGRLNYSQSKTFFGFLKKSTGFTLIELIVVVGILSILAIGSIAVLNPVDQFHKANDSRRKSDLAQIQKALETYYQDFSSYPESSSAEVPLYRIMYTIPGQPTPTTLEWGTSWIPYMNILPKDPNTSKNYVYYSTGQAYYLYASLDRGNLDPQSCQNLNANGECVNVPAPNLCGTGVKCNYGVTSPNVSP